MRRLYAHSGPGVHRDERGSQSRPPWPLPSPWPCDGDEPLLSFYSSFVPLSSHSHTDDYSDMCHFLVFRLTSYSKRFIITTLLIDVRSRRVERLRRRYNKTTLSIVQSFQFPSAHIVGEYLLCRELK